MKCNAGIMEIFIAVWSDLQFNNLAFLGLSAALTSIWICFLFIPNSNPWPHF